MTRTPGSTRQVPATVAAETASPTTPAPTPAPIGALFALAAMQAKQAASAPNKPASKSTPIGYPIQPKHPTRFVAPDMAAASGYVWARRVAHPTSTKCLGDIRLFDVNPFGQDGKLPALEPGTRFDSHVASDKAPAGTWLVTGKPADYGKPTRVNNLYPLVAS